MPEQTIRNTFSFCHLPPHQACSRTTDDSIYSIATNVLVRNLYLQVHWTAGIKTFKRFWSPNTKKTNNLWLLILRGLWKCYQRWAGTSTGPIACLNALLRWDDNGAITLMFFFLPGCTAWESMISLDLQAFFPAYYVAKRIQALQIYRKGWNLKPGRRRFNPSGWHKR